jgi:spore coat protein CotF
MWREAVESTTSKQQGRQHRSSKVNDVEIARSKMTSLTRSMRRDDVVDEIDEKVTSSHVKTLPKNFIRPLTVHDLKGNGFERPTLPIADARRCSG